MRPERVDLRPKRAIMMPEGTDERPAIADFRPGYSKPEIVDLQHGRAS